MFVEITEFSMDVIRPRSQPHPWDFQANQTHHNNRLVRRQQGYIEDVARRCGIRRVLIDKTHLSDTIQH
jgi:hypothetical protein